MCKDRTIWIYANIFSANPYDDDIPGQVAGAVCVGMQCGAIFGVMHTQNMAREAGIFQSVGMPNNRWLPLHKATFGFKARIWITCMVQSSSFLAAYALTDGVLCQMRGRDDLWNPIAGGFASGAVLWAWYKKPANTVSAGIYFGCIMSWFRFMGVPDGCPKLNGYLYICIVLHLLTSIIGCVWTLIALDMECLVDCQCG